MALDKIVHTRVIHSSLKEVRRLGTDSDFPAHTPSIGALIRMNHFGGAVLETHTPKFSSLVEGETFECDMSDLDTELRVRILTLASTCKSLAAELLDHAARLESQAKSESDLIDNLASQSDSPDSGFVPSTCKPHTRIVESEPKVKLSAKAPNLALFD
jgi:hypothetical protein